MLQLKLIPQTEFARIHAAPGDLQARLHLLADMCRANTLMAVKRAGSGHLGSSLSAMDIVVWLYYHQMNTVKLGVTHPDRDIYFSSKGHDVPGLYAVLYSLGILEKRQILSLRRLGGLDGHPDVGIRGIESNTGSLGMGIGKGRGMAWAKRHFQRSGHVYVMTGDGELQEGEIYESLQTTVHQKAGGLTVIVDRNEVQSDKRTEEITSLGDLEAKFRSFGWKVARCSGHDFGALAQALAAVRSPDCPGIVIADTIKGRGISFMEHPAALADGGGLYRWHAGAPPDEPFQAGYAELLAAVQQQAARLGVGPVATEEVEPEAVAAAVPALSLVGEPESQGKVRAPLKTSAEYVAEAYGQALVAAARRRSDLVVLDADLAADCKIREFEKSVPERFIENGIAEQDMVSMAGGMARQGLLPVVNSFANFLAARANEQIYNNATEKTKIIYALHYAGLIPAGPGKSHQSIRDISLLGALPNVIVVQPVNGAESALLLDYCVDTAAVNCAIRLNIGPCPRTITLPHDYVVREGHGVELHPGTDALLVTYGPVMAHEALLAAEHLALRGFRLRVVNMPWLNRVDPGWLAQAVAGVRAVVVVEDHAPVGGLGDCLLRELVRHDLLQGRPFEVWGVEKFPACGTPAQALRYHRLDGASLAERVVARTPGA